LSLACSRGDREDQGRCLGQVEGHEVHHQLHRGLRAGIPRGHCLCRYAAPRGEPSSILPPRTARHDTLLLRDTTPQSGDRRQACTLRSAKIMPSAWADVASSVKLKSCTAPHLPRCSSRRTVCGPPGQSCTQAVASRGEPTEARRDETLPGTTAPPGEMHGRPCTKSLLPHRTLPRPLLHVCPQREGHEDRQTTDNKR
jgi:hypothetical protein